MATDADHYNNTMRIPLWNGVNFYATNTVIFAQLDISAQPLKRDAKQESAPAEIDAQFAANQRASTLVTSCVRKEGSYFGLLLRGILPRGGCRVARGMARQHAVAGAPVAGGV
jgi:TctA family transporter